MITVFYDGKCGICKKEIDHYRKIAPADTFIWDDITISDKRVLAAGLTMKEALSELHVIDKKGQINKGIDSFITIWRSLPAWKILAVIFSLPIIHGLANLAYRAFARWRFNRLEHCQIYR